IATVGLLEDIERHAVDLTLTAMPTLPGANNSYTQQTFADAANLVIGTGARIEGDVGADISLNSSSRLLVDGTISAAAGNIDLRLNNSLAIAADGTGQYFADQGIWLGDNAQLLARGAAVTEVDDQGRIIGDVLSGGTISIDADRGHVLTSSGSLIDVSGTSAQLSIKSDARGRYQTRQIGSAAGTVDIEASEAILIGGQLKGESGDPGNLAGGTLRVSLDTSERNDPGQSRPIPESTLPGGDRTIEVTQQSLDLSFADSTLSGYSGRAVVAAEQVTEGGFDALELSSRTTWTSEGAASTIDVHVGRVEFDGDVSLALDRSLTVNAAVIASDGGEATLSAPIVTLGSSELDHNNLNSQYQAPAQAGTGSLNVEAGQIDVIGTSVLQGFADATLKSSGDLRLIGVQIDPPQGVTGSPALKGSLSTAGDLTLSAAQVYPTTLTQFTVAAGVDADEGKLTVTQNGTAGDALSAGGALTLSADEVVQSGTVRAPFGSITIDSPSITLTDGSVTSTSGAGLNVLYGETEGGLNWVYVLGSKKIIYGDGSQRIVDQRVALNGDRVALEEGAVLDVSGGGNLLATEFTSGTTGTLDVLGEDNTFGGFAIIPASRLQSAAYDQSIYGESGFEGGRSIYLSGTGNLPAGEYIVLPAKFALLPGAYLVRPVSGYQDISASESYGLSDGSTVVSGYFTHTGSGLRDSARTSGFAILDGKAVQNKAKYTLTNANDFFAASGESAATQRLPQDAGRVAITATESLILEGTLRANAAEGGRGAALDIASSAIEVVSDLDSAGSTVGVLKLDAGDLNALGAESILLGGVRHENEDGIDITTNSSTVTIAEGAALVAPEVMLAATNTVTVERNASITASGAEVQAQDVGLTGDGAFVRVATSEAANVQRSSAGNAGRVIIADGASLTATGGSISLESSGGADLSGALSAAGGEVSLTGNLISLGNVNPSVGGWVLDAAQLSRLDADTLSLNSRSAIDWYGDVDLAFSNLNLSARALRGYDDGTVSIDAAGDVTFTGGDAATNPTDATGNGQLHLTANNVVFDGGAVEMSGFESVGLLANREVRADDTTTVSVVGGDLQLGAQRISTQSGVDLAISADRAARLSNSGSTQALEAVNELGGSFSLTASSIELATRIELPSGLVSLNATNGGVALTGSAAIDVSGRATEFADQMAYSHGGTVSLDAASGDVVLAEGSRIDVSAEGGADAGSIELSAAAGSLQLAGALDGSAAAGGEAGSFSADAQNLGDFADLTQRLGADGFAGDLSFRQRGTGDLTVASGATVQGTSVSMTADQGNIVVAGNIVAHDTGGGRIDLSASDGMTLSGTLDARSTNSDERNGRIALNVSDGGLNVTDSAVIATVASGAATGTSGDGDVAIRLPQQSLLTVIDADSANDAVHLGGDWSQTADVSVEGFAV
ncbi:beta strand repeat-containing protein, partial [Steroidobacter sp.]|uniref:beta strand repeat-containing protein n=1 Tax=Steroidobacter sp. TaxID=1978227 RepID=UPI001A5666D5